MIELAELKLKKLFAKPDGIQRMLRHLGEPTEVPPRAPARDPPCLQENACCEGAAASARRSSSGSPGAAEPSHPRLASWPTPTCAK